MNLAEAENWMNAFYNQCLSIKSHKRELHLDNKLYIQLNAEDRYLGEWEIKYSSLARRQLWRGKFDVIIHFAVLDYEPISTEVTAPTDTIFEHRPCLYFAVQKFSNRWVYFDHPKTHKEFL